jgi:UDP-galactopyranose mutase
VVANYNGEMYNLPFNMNTFNKLWGVVTPQEAQNNIVSQLVGVDEPSNLEKQAFKMVGRDIYEKLIKGYTEKQWGRVCAELPPFIIKRLPVRYTYDNSYFDDPYQGIPIGGYTQIFESLLEGVDVELGIDFKRSSLEKSADRIIYTGCIDVYYDYQFGALEYRGLRFETQTLDNDNYQGTAVVNYTDRETPYTRIIEHKHFEFGKQKKTVITHEYPANWEVGEEPYYPINCVLNNELYSKYRAIDNGKVVFGGRLATYRYLDMDQVVSSALDCVKDLVKNEY